MDFTDSHGNIVKLPEGAAVAWRISAYAIVKDSVGRFLMVQSGNGLWQFPGGGVEQNETIAQALVREVQEETGYTIEAETQPFYTNEQQFYHRREEVFYHSLQLFFYAKLALDTHDPTLISEEDKQRAQGWVELDALSLEVSHPTMYALLDKLIYKPYSNTGRYD